MQPVNVSPPQTALDNVKQLDVTWVCLDGGYLQTCQVACFVRDLKEYNYVQQPGLVGRCQELKKQEKHKKNKWKNTRKSKRQSNLFLEDPNCDEINGMNLRGLATTASAWWQQFRKKVMDFQIDSTPNLPYMKL